MARRIYVCLSVVLTSNSDKHRQSLRSGCISLLPCSHDLVSEKTAGSGVLWVCGLVTKGRRLGHFSAGLAACSHWAYLREQDYDMLYPKIQNDKIGSVFVCVGKSQDIQKVERRGLSKGM